MTTFGKPRSNWQDYIVILCLIVFFFGPIFVVHSFLIPLNINTDFEYHNNWAADMRYGKDVPDYVLAHAMWQITLAFLNLVTGIPFNAASLISAILYMFLTAIILIRWLIPIWDERYKKRAGLYALIMGMLVATPISLLWFEDRLMYFGYIGIASYHNPTMIVLRPLALLQFIYAFLCFHPSGLTPRNIMLAGLISALATFAKPSFAICILPAVGILSMILLAKKRYVDIKGLILGIIAPTVIVLAAQYLATYHEADGDGILFLPFVVMSIYSRFLLPKLILSILFPLVVLFFYYKNTLSDARMQLAWLIFVFGIIYTYLFAESGYRMGHGNFGWSGEIASFVLFMTATVFYMEKLETSFWKMAVIRGVWAAHVGFGIAYYFYSLFGGNYI
jgi:hypothetical protein